MKLRIDLRRGLQDTQLDQLADLMSAQLKVTAQGVASEEELHDYTWRQNRLQLELLRGCLLMPGGDIIQVNDGGDTRQ